MLVNRYYHYYLQTEDSPISVFMVYKNTPSFLSNSLTRRSKALESLPGRSHVL